MIRYSRRDLDDREIHRRWIDPRLASVRVADIRAYLLRKGWKEVPPDREGVLVFQEPLPDVDGALYQWVPDSERGRDYEARLYEVIAAVAEIEDRHAGDVLSDILSEPAGGAPNGAARRGVSR